MSWELLDLGRLPGLRGLGSVLVIGRCVSVIEEAGRASDTQYRLLVMEEAAAGQAGSATHCLRPRHCLRPYHCAAIRSLLFQLFNTRIV
jgi:hypothetical protein